MASRGGCVRVVVLVFLAPILIGLGAWFFSNLSRVVNHDTTDGVIVDLIRGTDSDGDASYTPVYEYEVDGETYRYRSAVSYGGVLVPDLGDRRTMLYNPADPTDARVHNLFLLIWLPLILMAVPVLIVVAVFWGMRRRQRLADAAPPWADEGQVPAPTPEWPLPQPDADGTPAATAPSTTIEATFMGTEPSQMDAAGNVRYRVKARTEIDGKLHRFRSEWVDEDPTLYYMQHGNKVEVRIDPADPSSYEVTLPPSD
ncbi:MAG: DUF3592 domain-containing protein [Acidimicrobiia bacterium]|nr:DUF3592 domain-containing protein [Acidimicrobiia bacterium]